MGIQNCVCRDVDGFRGDREERWIKIAWHKFLNELIKLYYEIQKIYNYSNDEKYFQSITFTIVKY